MSVIFWRTDDVPVSFMDKAVDAVEELTDQIDYFDIYVDKNEDDTLSVSGGDWEEVLGKSFTNHVVDNYGCPLDDVYHFLLINQPFSEAGAGWTYGTINKPDNTAGSKPYKKYTEGCDSRAPVSGANIAVKFFIDNFPQYGDNGDKAFKGTVLHNVIHAIVPYGYDSTISFPSDSCSDDPAGNDHSLGTIRETDSGNAVTPAQLWYTKGFLSGNSPPCDNCDSNPEQAVNEISLNISSCTDITLKNSGERLDI